MELVGASPLIAGLTRNLHHKIMGTGLHQHPAPISFQSSPRGLALPEGVPVPAHECPTQRSKLRVKSEESIVHGV